jgi:hypothetical protein
MSHTGPALRTVLGNGQPVSWQTGRCVDRDAVGYDGPDPAGSRP